MVDGGRLERSAPVLRNFDPFAGQVTSRLGSSSEFSGRGHGLEALGDWRRPLEGMGQRGGSAERRARQAAHPQGSRLHYVGPPRRSFGGRSMDGIRDRAGMLPCLFSLVAFFAFHTRCQGLAANKPDKHQTDMPPNLELYRPLPAPKN